VVTRHHWTSTPFIAAGLWPSKETRDQLKTVDSTGRLMQAQVNAPMIINICHSIKQYAPDAIVYVMTNLI